MKIDKSLLSGSTPMLLLSLLRDGDMYGYEMVAELRRRSEGVFELKEGTLYPLLHALEKEKYVRAYEKTAPNGRARRYYALTEAGRRQLDDRTEAWALYARAVNAVLGGAAPARA